MLIGTNLEYAKAYNYRIVLETIRLFGPVSRADIARRTELTAQTISNITRKLLKADLIRETDRYQEGRGAPSMLLALNPDGVFSIGLDLDKDHLTGVLVDFIGCVRQRIHFELNFPSPEESMELLEKTARELVLRENLEYRSLAGIGVGLPGPLGIMKDSIVTNVVNPSAFPGWKNVPVSDILNKRLSLPIFLENNATAAAVGERRYGAGRHIRNFFYIYFGAGLGGGLIINGQPFEGHTGNAGELGFYPTASERDETALFERPHLGVYFNLPRLYRILSEDRILVSEPAQLAPLFAEQHPALMSWLDTAAQKLAPLLLVIEYLIDPEAIIFGGRLPVDLIRYLMQQLERIVPSLRVDGKTEAPRLLYATSGADAAALGVATLPMHSSYAPTPGLLMRRYDGTKTEVFSPIGS